MAIIFRPQGPLSLPCENTTVSDITPHFVRLMLKNRDLAAVTTAMALEEELPDARQELRRAIDCLEGSADLKDVPLAALEALAAGAVHFSLPAGSVLFESGSTPEGVYLVASAAAAAGARGEASAPQHIQT